MATNFHFDILMQYQTFRFMVFYRSIHSYFENFIKDHKNDLIFCFNNLFEVLKKFVGCSWGYDKDIRKADIPKALKWNLIKQFINL